MARDITDGRSTRAIAVDVGVVASTAIWQNTDTVYDVAVGGKPFIYAITDQRPYVRQTAPFRKDQFDNGQEPGEQSLIGWWIRSQSSFHRGAGIKFYDPTGGETTAYRFFESRGVNVWTKGQVTLLNNCTASSHYTTGAIDSYGRSTQHLRSIKWNSTSGVLLHDEYDVDKIAVDGTLTHYIDYTAGTDSPVYGICDDGTYTYWITNTATKKTVYKKPLTGDSTTGTTSPTVSGDVTKMFDEIGSISNAVMEYVKDRIVMCADNKVYEFAGSAVAMPTALYTHPVTTHKYTSIAASGPAIYVAGFNGIQSTIQKFTITSTGTMPTLTSAVTAAELPVGEVVHRIFYYLGYLLIGTNKGVRVATVTDTTGDLTYGPLLFESSQPVYDFAARDRYVWAATGIDVEGQSEPGLTRIDLGEEIETLRFAYANDVEYEGVYGHQTTACAFADGTDRITFCTAYADSANGDIYIEDDTTLIDTGFITTGNLRYSTLEPKNFKRLLGRGDFTYGSLVMETVDADGLEYDHITYDSTVHNVEVTTSVPATAQEYVAYKFVFNRDATDTTQGPIFKGYQSKATIATPRQRIIKFPVFCYDLETDRYNVLVGYEGKALERLRALEDVEASGDVVTWQDFTTGELRQAVIEEISFTRLTPPDRRFDGMGGIIDITIRTV